MRDLIQMCSTLTLILSLKGDEISSFSLREKVGMRVKELISCPSCEIRDGFSIQSSLSWRRKTGSASKRFR